MGRIRQLSVVRGLFVLAFFAVAFCFLRPWFDAGIESFSQLMRQLQPGASVRVMCSGLVMAFGAVLIHVVAQLVGLDVDGQCLVSSEEQS